MWSRRPWVQIPSLAPLNFAKATLNLTMYYTYILRSKKQPGAIYIGSTVDLEKRLLKHNASYKDSYSKRYAPWEIETCVVFSEMYSAKKFEKYLKSSSGKAFMKKRLISDEFRKSLERFNNNRMK